MLYGRTILDTLHERVGDEEQLRDGPTEPGAVRAVWGRFITRHGHTDGGSLGIYGTDGPTYSSNIDALQVGSDLYRSDSDSGRRDHAGVMATYGVLDVNVDHNLLEQRLHAGTMKSHNYSIGGYWTHFEPDGAYLDAVAQYTWSHYRMTSVDFDLAHTRGTALALSAEGGYPFALDERWRLEPQAQLTYQAIHIDNYDDPASEIRYPSADSLVGRLGARLARQGRYEGWLRFNLLHEFMGKLETQFSSDDGFVPFRASPPDTWWQVGGGFSFLLKDRLTPFAALRYERTFKGNSYSYSGRFGLRYNW